MVRPTVSLMLVAGLSAALAGPGSAQEFDRVSSSDERMVTGPAVGERIPEFSGYDQHGERVSWSEIKGPNGALILFYRSADW